MMCHSLVVLNGLTLCYLWNINSVVISALQRSISFFMIDFRSIFQGEPPKLSMRSWMIKFGEVIVYSACPHMTLSFLVGFSIENWRLLTILVCCGRSISESTVLPLHRRISASKWTFLYLWSQFKTTTLVILYAPLSMKHSINALSRLLVFGISWDS